MGTLPFRAEPVASKVSRDVDALSYADTAPKPTTTTDPSGGTTIPAGTATTLVGSTGVLVVVTR